VDGHVNGVLDGHGDEEEVATTNWQLATEKPFKVASLRFRCTHNANALHKTDRQRERKSCANYYKYFLIL